MCTILQDGFTWKIPFYALPHPHTWIQFPWALVLCAQEHPPCEVEPESSPHNKHKYCEVPSISYVYFQKNGEKHNTTRDSCQKTSSSIIRSNFRLMSLATFPVRRPCDPACWASAHGPSIVWPWYLNSLATTSRHSCTFLYDESLEFWKSLRCSKNTCTNTPIIEVSKRDS